MAQIIIGAGGLGNLTFSQGLTIVPGAVFPPSRGDAGIVFQGAGGASERAVDPMDRAFFAGAGGLFYIGSLAQKNGAVFAGSGSLLPSVGLGLKASIGFGGSGGAGA